MAKTASVRAEKELEQDQQQGPWRSLRNPAPGWLRQRSISESRKVAPSHAAIGGTSGSTCGPGRDRSGEFPFSLFLMPISLEKSTASRKIFFECSSCVVGMLLALDEPLTPIRRSRCTALWMRR